MSLIRQIWILIVGTILLSCAGSVLVSVWTARNSLETQLSVKNNDNAQSLALSLSHQGDDPALLGIAISAQFDTGHYQSIILRAPDGTTRYSRVSGEVQSPAPAWFVHLVPIRPTAGLGQVLNGWAQIGTLEVVSQSAYAYAGLWSACVSITLWTFAIGLVAATLGHLAVRRLRRQLDEVVQQADALTQRRFVRVKEPRTPELRRVAQAMNQMVARINQIFSEQAEQVDQLRVQASCDPLTGISHRRHFLASFEAHLGREDSSASAQLVLVRVRRLADVNRTLGHQRTDQMLRSIAHALGESNQNGAAITCFGRLNGADFAVVYPHATERDDQAVELLERLRQCLADTPGVAVVVSSVGCRIGMPMTELLAKADMGLAEAESKGDFAYIANGLEPAPLQGGEDTWRRALQATLLAARVQLMQFPVSDRMGDLVHMECPMRLQLENNGPFEPAARWLPFALRTGMSCDVDMAAVALAVTAIASDGKPRGVNLSPQSLAHPQFLPRLRERIVAAGASARNLWVEVDESALERHPEALVELCRQLRPHGVHLGLEHAGDRLSSIGLLLEPGLDYVKISSSWASGVRHDTARRSWLRSSVAMLHGVGLKVFVEGVQDAEDLPELWACGVDGVTGPAVKLPEAG